MHGLIVAIIVAVFGVAIAVWYGVVIGGLDMQGIQAMERRRQADEAARQAPDGDPVQHPALAAYQRWRDGSTEAVDPDPATGCPFCHGIELDSQLCNCKDKGCGRAWCPVTDTEIPYEEVPW